jgi:membrane protein
VGGAVTAVLLEAGKFLIGLYLGKSGVGESFQAAGSLVVLLAWVYYAAQIFLLGAEFTKVYSDDRGGHAGQCAVQATRVSAEVAAQGTDVLGSPGPPPAPPPAPPARPVPEPAVGVVVGLIAGALLSQVLGRRWRARRAPRSRS